MGIQKLGWRIFLTESEQVNTFQFSFVFTRFLHSFRSVTSDLRASIAAVNAAQVASQCQHKTRTASLYDQVITLIEGIVFHPYSIVRFVRRTYDISWAGPGGSIGATALPKTYESNLIHHNFVQFGKKHSRDEVISSSCIVLSQQLREAYFISLTGSETVMRFDYQILLKLPPSLNLLAGSAPVICKQYCVVMTVDALLQHDRRC